MGSPLIQIRMECAGKEGLVPYYSLSARICRGGMILVGGPAEQARDRIGPACPLITDGWPETSKLASSAGLKSRKGKS
jgi:hypothetical protein